MNGPPIVRGTAAWRYFGDFRTALLAGQVLLLQVAHPVVGAGVRDHSNYTEDPWYRLGQTGASVAICIYGGPEGARFEARRLRGLHRRFTGFTEDGRRYHGLDPHAYAWVHATLVKVPVDAQRFFGHPLREDELAEYYAQMSGVGRMLGLREKDIPPDWQAFERYYDEMVTGLGPNKATTTLLDTIGRVPKPFPWLPDPLWIRLRRGQEVAQLFLIRATLPPAFRERLGLQWTEEQQWRFERFARSIRLLGSLAPASVRNSHMRVIGRLNVWLRAHPAVHERLTRR